VPSPAGRGPGDPHPVRSLVQRGEAGRVPVRMACCPGDLVMDAAFLRQRPLPCHCAVRLAAGGRCWDASGSSEDSSAGPRVRVMSLRHASLGQPCLAPVASSRPARVSGTSGELAGLWGFGSDLAVRAKHTRADTVRAAAASDCSRAAITAMSGRRRAGWSHRMQIADLACPWVL
jgi:hypothetical protein